MTIRKEKRKIEYMTLTGCENSNKWKFFFVISLLNSRTHVIFPASHRRNKETAHVWSQFLKMSRSRSQVNLISERSKTESSTRSHQPKNLRLAAKFHSSSLFSQQRDIPLLDTIPDQIHNII